MKTVVRQSRTYLAGLIYFRTRNYHPTLGRFMSRDSIAYLGSRWNLYEYASSSPATLNDPLGTNPVIGIVCRWVFKRVLVPTTVYAWKTVAVPGGKYVWQKVAVPGYKWVTKRVRQCTPKKPPPTKPKPTPTKPTPTKPVSLKMRKTSGRETGCVCVCKCGRRMYYRGREL